MTPGSCSRSVLHAGFEQASVCRVQTDQEAPSHPPHHQVAPLALFWWLYVVSGVTALRFLNVPMYRWGPVFKGSRQVDLYRSCAIKPYTSPLSLHASVLRRSTTLVVVAGEYVAFHKVPTGLSLVSGDGGVDANGRTLFGGCAEDDVLPHRVRVM